MDRVCDVMRTVAAASPDESVFRAGSRMESLQMAGLPVVDTEGRLLGLLTLWDVRRSHPNRLVVDAMKTHVVTVPSNLSTWEARDLAQQHATDHLVVVDEGRLVGMVTREDLAIAVARLTDALTGLPAAAYLRNKIHALWQSGRELCLIFIDINEFGPLNKRLGHATGDRALQTVARVIARHVDPERDLACRYGGDEFAIITFRTSSEAQHLAGELVREVSSSTRAAGIELSISVGIAGGRRRSARQPDPDTVDNLINLASTASTNAKRISGGILAIDIAAGA